MFPHRGEVALCYKQGSTLYEVFQYLRAEYRNTSYRVL